MSELTTADKIAAYLGTGLVVLGVAVIGFIETLGGSPHAVQEDGQVVHDALVPIDIRAYIILAGLLIWGLYAIYKVVATTPAPATTESV